MTQLSPVVLALLGTGFTFLATALGAATVYLFKREVRPSFQQVFLGFAAGVMVAASVWSLLIPAMEMAGERNCCRWRAVLCLAHCSCCCWTGSCPTCIPAASRRRGRIPA